MIPYQSKWILTRKAMLGDSQGSLRSEQRGQPLLEMLKSIPHYQAP
jgi:hypothetical protein